MGKRKHLIIGCGPAALAAVQAIRSQAPDDEVKLVTRENYLPYSPAALPYLFSGELKESTFFARGEDFLKALDIQLIRGQEVVEILPQTRQVGYRDGRREEYDKLLLATGSHPWVPPVEGLEGVPYYTLRTFEDFKKMQPLLHTKRTVAIYGAGLVAVELAEKLTLAGHAVTLIARSSLLRRYFGRRITQALQRRLTDKGVRVFTNSPLRSVHPAGKKLIFTCGHGETLTADLFLIATGVTPNRIDSPFLHEAAGGVQTGRSMETNLPDVYAAGDVASAPSFFADGHGLSPILPEAVEQGKVAGYNMAGEKTPYRGWLPWNFLRCFEHYAFNIGFTGPAAEERAEVFEKEEGEGLLRLIFKDHFLTGVEGLNLPSMNPGVFGYLITRRVPIEGYQRLLLQKPMERAEALMLRHRQSHCVKFPA